MRRSSSPLLRAVRALTALVTVWCLGCSAYEPLLGWVFGAKGNWMMACDSDPAVTAQDVPMPLGTSHEISAPSSRDSHDYDCGCGGSCHAPSASATRLGELRSPVSVVIAFQPAEPSSVSRTPLLPPPELRLA